MLSKRTCIVAGGPKQFIPDFSVFGKKEIFWIGVDKGVYYLIEKGIIPDLAVGDFDSVSKEELAVLEEKVPSFRRFLPEKDETDMELALMSALEKSPSCIKIFGGTGGRLDHFLANAMMLASFKKEHPSIEFSMIDKQNSLSVFLPGSYVLEHDPDKRFVSFIPVFGDVSGLTLNGFKYPLLNRYVRAGSSLCISNELIQQTGHFSFEKGILMMIRSKD